MKITTVTVANFKGLSERFDTERFNLFVGPNGSGKTARLLAPQFAIAGTTPFGARPDDAFKLCSADRLRVHVLLDDGFTWTRAIIRDPRQKTLQTEVTVVGRSELGMREASALVAETVGTFAPMFDLGAFLDLSSDKRRDFVLDLCAEAADVGESGTSMLPRELLIELYKIELGPGTVEQYLARCEPDLNGLKEKLGTDKAGYLDEVMVAVTSGFTENPAESLAEALRLGRVLTNGTKQNRDRAQQATQKLSERKAKCVVSAGSAADLEERLQALTNQREEIVKQLEHQAGRDSARVALQRSLEAATSRLTAAQDESARIAATPEPDMAEAEKLEAEAKVLDVEKPAGDLEALTEDVAQAKTGVNVSITEKTLHAGHVVTAAASARTLEASLKRAKESPWQKALDLADGIDIVLSITKDDPPAEWTLLYELITENAKLDNIAHFEATLAKAKDTVKDVDHRDAELTTAVNEAEDFLATAEEALRSAEATNRETERLCNENIRKRETLRTEFGRIAIAHANWATIQERTAKQMKEHTGEQVGAQKLLNELDAEGGHINVDDLRKQQGTVEIAIATAKTELEAKRSYAVLDTELTACIAQAERETVLHELSKSMCDAIRALRERLMERMVSPLLDRLNAFLDVAAPGRKAYCELVNAKGTPAFELGWIVSGGTRSLAAITQGALPGVAPQPPGPTTTVTEDVKVPLPALSGGETALFGAGLAYALVSLAKVPLKLLLLEAGEVDADNLKRIMKAISHVGRDLSNVMIAAHADPKWLDSGWNVVKLEGK